MILQYRSLLNFMVLLFVFNAISPSDCRSAAQIIEMSGNLTVRAGREANLVCKTDARVDKCVWLYQTPQRYKNPALIGGYPGHGDGANDCSLRLLNVSETQTGFWICTGRAEADVTKDHVIIFSSHAIFLQVLNVPVIKFEAVPTNRTFSIGSSVELDCQTNIPVQSCQWRFQQEGQTEPMVVTEGPPVNDTDCTFQMDYVSYEQVGQWRCGARTDESDLFTYTDIVYVQVEHKEEAFPIEFDEEPKDTEVHVGHLGNLKCSVRIEGHIDNCRWYWQRIGHSKTWSILMQEFLPNNNDCSLVIANMSSDAEGLWTCHVKPIHSSKYVASKPAKLTIRGEVAVSILTREISVIEGEELVLNCLAEDIARSCQWTKKDLCDSNNSDSAWPFLIDFFPADNASRDCSLRFDHAQRKHQGLWTCGIKVEDDKPFQHTLPTIVSIKIPSRVRFLDGVRSQLAVQDQPLTLHCNPLSAVNECTWTWYEDESKVSERVVKFNLTYDGSGVYNCSVVIPKVDRSLQGIWQCAAKYKYNNISRTDYASPFSLTVVKPGAINFRAVSQLVHAHPDEDGEVTLECITKEPLEECLWLYQLNKTSEAKEATRFDPMDFNNCSTKVKVKGSIGIWTCGVRSPGETNFTMAPTTRLATFEQGTVVSKSLTHTDGIVVLSCQLKDSSAESPISCNWFHPSEYNVWDFNATEKYVVESDPLKKTCSLTLHPKLIDIGHWKCVFSRDNQSHVLGEASFTLLSSPHNIRLTWLVGVLATATVMLTVLLFAVITCRFLQCRNNKATVQFKETAEARRYTADPTKGINFSFTEVPEVLVDFPIPTQDSTSHHYERVGRFSPSRGSFYQNVS